MQRVGIVGLGYVGLPLAVAFAEEGLEVIAVDVDHAKLASIAAGESYIEDVSSKRLGSVSERITATPRYAKLTKADAIVVCVPTPLTANREPDLGVLRDAGVAIAGVLQEDQLIVLESTTYPGTTRERLVPLLEESGMRAGHDFHVAYSPERVDPGRTDFTMRTTPKVVGGLTPACGDRAEELYAHVCDDVVRVSSPDVAELTKLLENIFRSVNIALVNELTLLCDRMGIDIWEVVDAAATKPYGFMRFDPGPGMGGHCLPVDPFYLSWRAREFDMATEFIELAGKINQDMPYKCVERVERALNDQAKAVRGARVAILGISYKPDVADTRQSPALKIIALLKRMGAEVAYHDPYVPELQSHLLRSAPYPELLEGADLVVILTAHSAVDHRLAVECGSAILDLRGVTRHMRAGTAARQ
jgi:UDP-N-acetyl-D-glucosamine dehydrogenase